MKARGLLVLLLAVAGGCAVGSGSGSASGDLFVIGCKDGANFGAPNGATGISPIAYDLGPTFFAGTPIEDQGMGQQVMNQIEIFMQSSGLEQMYTDTLFYEVVNSYEVARCVRGRTVNGQPDYLLTEPLPLTLATTANPSPTTLWCDWTGTAFSDGGVPDAANPGPPDAGTSLDGGMSMMAAAPRIHLTPYTDIRPSLSLGQTCPGGNVAGQGVDGWIEFQNFGSAEQSNLAPQDRTPVPANFVINFDERLRATFHVVIGDSRVVTAIENGSPLPTSPPNIGGELDGFFDFDLARGRAGQPFP